MLDVGGIIAKMVLNKDQWTQAVYEAKGDVDKLADKVKEISGKIEDMGKKMALAGGVMVGALTAMGLKTMSTADNIQEMGQRTGVSTRTLQELGYAARLSGSSLEGLESTIRIMQRNVADAAAGNEQLTMAFANLGVSVNQLKTMNPEEQFMTLAKAVADVKDPTERAGIAMDVFGKQGTALLPMLADGSKGLDDLRQAANDAGVVMSDTTVKSAAALQDKFDNMKESVSGLFTTIGTAFLPIIEKVTEKVTAATQAFSNWSKEHPVLSSVLVNLTAVIGAALLAMGTMLIVIPKLVAGFVTLTASTGALGTAFTVMMGPIGIAAAAGIALIAVINGISSAYDKAIQEITDATKREGDAFKEFNAYRKQASAEERALIAEMVAQKRSEGKTMEQIYTEINEYLRQNSDEYQKWKGTAEDTGNAVIAKHQEVKENVVQNLLDQIAAKEDAAFKEKEAFIQSLQQQAEAEAAYNEERVAAIEENLTWIQERNSIAQNLWQGIMDARRQLSIKYAEDDRIRLDLQYQQEKQRIENSQIDQATKEALVDELHKNYLIERDKVDETYAEKEKQRRGRSLQNTINQIHQAVQAITQTWSNYYEWQIKKLDKDYDKRKDWIMKNVTDEKKRDEMLRQLDEELTNKKNALMRKQAVMDKASAIAGAIVNTAQAVTKALTAGPIIGPILAGIIGAMGAFQIGIIAASPIPEAAEGGITTGDTLARVGDNPSGVEAIIPLEKASEMGFGGSNIFNISIQALDTSGVERVFYDKIMPLIEKASRNEYFQINAATVRSF